MRVPPPPMPPYPTTPAGWPATLNGRTPLAEGLRHRTFVFTGWAAAAAVWLTVELSLFGGVGSGAYRLEKNIMTGVGLVLILGWSVFTLVDIRRGSVFAIKMWTKQAERRNPWDASRGLAGANAHWSIFIPMILGNSVMLQNGETWRALVFAGASLVAAPIAWIATGRTLERIAQLETA